MFPFINVFGYMIPMYAVMAGLGIGLAFLVTWLRAKKKFAAEERSDLYFMLLYALIGVLIGAKALYFIQNLGKLFSDFSLLWTNPEVFFGGFVFYGGLIGGVLGAWIYCKQFRLKLFDYANTVLTAIPIIHGLGRVGCLCVGCCYGMPADPPFGWLFNASPVAPHDIHLLPVQLFEVFTNIIIFIWLYVYTNKPNCPRHGGVALYMTWYAITRFIIEYFRFDDVERGFVGFLSTSQFISVFILLGGILLWWKGDQIVAWVDKIRPEKPAKAQ